MPSEFQRKVDLILSDYTGLPRPRYDDDGQNVARENWRDSIRRGRTTIQPVHAFVDFKTYELLYDERLLLADPGKGDRINNSLELRVPLVVVAPGKPVPRSIQEGLSSVGVSHALVLARRTFDSYTGVASYNLSPDIPLAGLMQVLR